MLCTQSLIGGLNMRKGYEMYYHVEMSEISHVNLKIGLRNEKYKMYVAISWNIAKKGEAAVSLYSVLWYITPPLQSS